MPTLTEGDLSAIGFCLIFAIIVAITRFACPDEYPETAENFDPHVWCPLDCMGDEGQTEPCDDCPYVGPPVPRYMGRCTAPAAAGSSGASTSPATTTATTSARAAVQG